MIDAQTIADLARRLGESLPPSMRAMQSELETTFRTLLTAQLGKLDLVTREEFDAQVKVLTRTREKIDALEKQLAEIKAAEQ